MKMRVRVNAFTVMEVDVEKCAESIGRSPDEVYEALVVAELTNNFKVIPTNYIEDLGDRAA
jgi:hypothetical protein